MAKAEASLIRRNLNFLLKPYKAKADADEKVNAIKEEIAAKQAALSKAKQPFYAGMAKDKVKGTQTTVSAAVSALQAELKGVQTRRREAEDSFEPIVAAGSIPTQ